MVIELIIAVALKMFFVASFYSGLKLYYRNRLETLTVSYVFSYAIFVLILLILSIFQKVNRAGILISMLFIGLATYMYGYQVSKRRASFAKEKILKKTDIIPLMIFAIIFFFLFSRVFFYYDTTDDALVQGMPKLAFIQQHETLFVHYDSLTVNTFSNECLGEMNGLYYMLMCGKDMAAGFGNVEIYGFIILACMYCVKSYGYKGKYATFYAMIAATMPCITGIAMTIKTDLISIILLPLAIAFLMQYYKEENSSMLFASIITIGATAASKISVLPAAGLLLVALVIYYFLKAKEKPVLPVVLGGIIFVVFCNRYIINLFQYQNPFQRALNEKMSFSFQNFLNSIKGCILEFNEAAALFNSFGKDGGGGKLGSL